VLVTEGIAFGALTLLVGRHVEHPAYKNLLMRCWTVGVVICLERDADCLRVVQLMPLLPKTPSSLASFKLETDCTFLVLANPGCPGKEAVQWV